MGAQLQEAGGSVLVAGGPVVGGSLYEAGIDRLDRIVSVEGVATAPDSLMAVVGRRRVGDTVRMEVEGRGGRRTVPVVLRESPAVEVVTYESAGRPVTDAMRAFRRAWLASRVEERAER
jgi:predicted metalloprotease with PDZ domain